MKPVATGAWLHTGSSSRPSITGGAPERRRASRLRRSRSAGSQPSGVGQGAAWTADIPKIPTEIQIAMSRSGFMSGLLLVMEELERAGEKVSGKSRPFGANPHSPNPLSPGLPPDLTGERGLKNPFDRISPSSPVRSGGRPGEEGRGDEGPRCYHWTVDRDDDLVHLLKAYQAGELAAFERLYAARGGGLHGFFLANSVQAQVARGAGVQARVQDPFRETPRSRHTYLPPLP